MSLRSALEGSERATVLNRLKGALATLAGCAALDPLCAWRSDAITPNGRMRRETVRLAIDVLDAVASASPKTTLARLATWIAVLTAVSLPAPSAVVAANTESKGPKSDLRDALARAQQLRLGAFDELIFKAPTRFALLRELARSYDAMTCDVVRTQCRLKALYLSHGIHTPGQTVYAAPQRSE